MSNKIICILLSFAMAYTPGLAVAAKSKADFSQDGPVFVRQLLKELPINKQEISKKKMLNFFLEKQQVEYHQGAKKFFKFLPLKKLPKYQVDRVKLPNGQDTYKISFTHNKKYVSMEMVFGPKVYARVNGYEITNKDMLHDAGRGAMMKALGVSPAKRLFPASVVKKLNKGERALYTYHLRKVVMAMDAVQKANEKARNAAVNKYKDLNALFMLLFGEKAYASEYDGNPCVNAGWTSQYVNGSCSIPGSNGCQYQGERGILCNPVIFGRTSGGNYCVRADNNASSSCDQQNPLTSPGNVRAVIESNGQTYNQQSVNALNAAIESAIRACANPPASNRADQEEACEVLRRRHGQFVAIQEDIIADIDSGPNTITPAAEEGPGFGERAGNWMRENRNWLIPVGIGVAALALILIMRNRNKNKGGDDPDPTPTDTPVGKPGEPETERWAGTGTLRVRQAAYAGWSTDDIGAMMRGTGSSGRPGVRPASPVDI